MTWSRGSLGESGKELQRWPKSAFLCLSVSSECLGSQQTVLHQLSVTDQSASDDVELVSLLYWPLQQLHQYSRVLLKLAACFDVVRKGLQLLLLLLSALELIFFPHFMFLIYPSVSVFGNLFHSHD